jgi:hypothetical protein
LVVVESEATIDFEAGVGGVETGVCTLDLGFGKAGIEVEERDVDMLDYLGSDKIV